jgi:hypothetical protein
LQIDLAPTRITALVIAGNLEMKLGMKVLFPPVKKRECWLVRCHAWGGGTCDFAILIYLKWQSRQRVRRLYLCICVAPIRRTMVPYVMDTLLLPQSFPAAVFVRPATSFFYLKKMQARFVVCMLQQKGSRENTALEAASTCRALKVKTTYSVHET